jgi:hypothetical protein
VGFVVEFDARNNILRVTFEGHLTDAVAFDCAETAARWAASHPRFRGIVDLSRVTKYDVSPESIRRLARTPPSPSPAAYTLVIVAPKEHHYGMSRMFQSLSEGTRPNQHVVHTMDEAYRLLQVESPAFGPADWEQTG